MFILRISICSVVLIILQVLKQIHIIQLNSYNLDQQLLWYKKNIKSFSFNICIILTILFFLFLSLLRIDKIQFLLFGFFFFMMIVSSVGILIENFPRKQKKKLVWTIRIKRLFALTILMFAILLFVPLIFQKTNIHTFNNNNLLNENYKIFIYYFFIVAMTPIITFLAYIIMLPIENAIRKKWTNAAKKIIEKIDNLTVIGVTGSFGKTSAKYFISTLLKTKYNVCMTPESYNTPLGATITIKNDLRNFDDYFICEMGARRLGDINEICEIVMPKIGIITDVGDMHLDTFKNIDNVLKCKFEIADSIYKNQNDGILFVNGDNSLIVDKIKEYDKNKIKIYTYGINKTNDFYVDNIVPTIDGTTFDFVINNDKKEVYNFKTKLLGLFNIRHLILSIALSYILDIDINKLKIEVEKIPPVEHRLFLINADENNLIIDDAYNANLFGTKNACDVINSFSDYKKIIITPGMVELGNKQNEENFEFAKYASSKVDMAFIVGKTNREALLNGFKISLSDDNIICFDKVEEAIFYARNNVVGKKVILLENDLSDNY